MEALQPYMNWIYLAGVVLAVLLFGYVMAQVFGRGVKARRGSRLSVSEYYEVDKSRYLILVRRDDVEHLLLVGGAQDLVVESSIGRPSHTRATEQRLNADDIADIPSTPASGPGNQPEPQLAGAHEGSDNIRPLPGRSTPRPPVFGDTRNLRAVERDQD